MPVGAFAAEEDDGTYTFADPEAHAIAAQILAEEEVEAAAEGYDADDAAFNLMATGITTYRMLDITLADMTRWQLLDAWVEETYAEIFDELDPDKGNVLRFADLRGKSGLTADQIDAYIDSQYSGRTGSLHGQGAAYIEAEATYSVNASFLLALSIWESGWGQSTLSKGFDYNGEDEIGGTVYPKGTYYNFYGIGAVDASPLSGGRTMAVKEGWSSPRLAILGAAKWINTNYIRRTRDQYAQPTLYHIFWDYERSNDTRTIATHEYSTDSYEANMVASFMSRIYASAKINPVLDYIIPRYKDRSFADVRNSDWFAAAVDYCSQAGIMNGYDSRTFKPNGNITRAQAAKVLCNFFVGAYADTAYGTTNTAPFSDVARSDAYTSAINWAYKEGIMNGSGGKFRPNDSITREELCTIVARAAEKIAGLPVQSAPHTAFDEMPDCDDVQGYAVQNVAWCLESGAIGGRTIAGEKYIAPQGTMSRAEMAQIMMNLLTKGILA